MKNRLKNTAKGAAIVGLALASVVSAQAQQVLVNSYAQGDLIAGFTTGSGNDLLVNLGPESWLVDGHYWDIASLLSSAGISATDPNLQFGVVGDSTGPQTVFSTHTGAILPNKINSISVLTQLIPPLAVWAVRSWAM